MKAAGEATLLRLAFRPPLEIEALSRAIVAHLVPGMERLEPDGRLTLVVRGPSGPALATIDLSADRETVGAWLRPADSADLPWLQAALRRWLDLDADLAPVVAALAADPRLAPLVAARPGLRVMGALDGGETALLTVIGQQVSLAAARTFAGRLVAAFGERAGDGLCAFPSAPALVEAGPERIRAAVGLTGARARTVHGLAEALAGGLRLDPGADRAAARAALLALPGIGPWTADYLAVRALGDRDAFPAGDLVLRRALGVRGPREAETLAERWRPWRAYALFHLWTAAAFS